MTKEKEDRRDVYNCIGGHIESDENVIQCAIKEAKEEAGINLVAPKVKGIINAKGFAGKNVMNFIVSGTTKDEPISTSLEGKLEWVDTDRIRSLNVFPDMSAILEKLLVMKDSEMFVGTTHFEGFKLLNISLHTI